MGLSHLLCALTQQLCCNRTSAHAHKHAHTYLHTNVHTHTHVTYTHRYGSIWRNTGFLDWVKHGVIHIMCPILIAIMQSSYIKYIAAVSQRSCNCTVFLSSLSKFSFKTYHKLTKLNIRLASPQIATFMLLLTRAMLPPRSSNSLLPLKFLTVYDSILYTVNDEKYTQFQIETQN